MLPLALAVWLIVCGIRGVRIGDHPVCRRCGFDLFGSPAGTVVCGECGADLARRRAIRIGHRRKRGGVLLAGILLMGVILGVGGTTEYANTKHVNGWHYAPQWYVLREAQSANAGWRSPALVELSARLKRGALSTPELDRALSAGLACQGDLSRPWDPAWGDFIEDANDAGRLSPELWRRYAQQAIAEPPSVSIPRRLHPGETVDWQLNMPAARLARVSNLGTDYSYLFQWLNDQSKIEMSVYPSDEEWGSPFALGGTSSRTIAPEGKCIDGTLSVTSETACGSCEFRAVVTVRIDDSNAASGHSKQVYLTKDVVGVAAFDVVPGAVTRPTTH
jgi:hypothetical protein